MSANAPGFSAPITAPDGRELTLPRVTEDLLIEVRPERRGQNGAPTDRPVCFSSVETALIRLIEGLGGSEAVRAVVFDPWQTKLMQQSVRKHTGCRVEELSFSAAEQMQRATLVRTMLYNGLIRLVPNPKRDTEWRRLQYKGSGIDHPAGGSKDFFDAEALMIWAAASNHCSELTLSWAP
jgi:hypothetical protein